MIAAASRLGFLPGSAEESALDYVRRLGRLRWRRRFPGRPAVELDGGRPASETFAAGEHWLVVRDEIAIPLPDGDLEPVAGHVVVATPRSPADPPVVHTLAELERARRSPAEERAAPTDAAPAVGFSVSDFPPASGETVRDYVRRLSSEPHRLAAPFAAVVFNEVAGTDPEGVCTRLLDRVAGTDPEGVCTRLRAPSGERPEVVSRFPAGVCRLLDVGCGSGEAPAALRRANPGMAITGIERHPASAERARTRVDRVLTGDAAAALRSLAAEGARFDAFLFADVLEHLEDPIGALTLARGLALPGATLVASVPNVGHLSLVRDLVAGRFDPLPAGLADAGHLRWFTRSSLEEALEEAGWRSVVIESLPGAPAPDSGEFLRIARSFPEVDEASLTAYQWIAVSRAPLGTRDSGPGTP